ncbi:hypothetical protein-transmembrane prediction [Rhodopirellula baltica SH 1]|uniref:Uncharacterized protein n=1 Tax=Rhodopirellula baltica (strain DSM 10527 / NCIMB 13988 / SH1) TaxID=243090 RepID=Q7UXX9_RHOBA|nr:hypothetical protein-transmembrane prediction [Rhodopirellula baltica SH 1]
MSIVAANATKASAAADKHGSRQRILVRMRWWIHRSGSVCRPVEGERHLHSHATLWRSRCRACNCRSTSLRHRRSGRRFSIHGLKVFEVVQVVIQFFFVVIAGGVQSELGADLVVDFDFVIILEFFFEVVIEIVVEVIFVDVVELIHVVIEIVEVIANAGGVIAVRVVVRVTGVVVIIIVVSHRRAVGGDCDRGVVTRIGHHAWDHRSARREGAGHEKRIGCIDSQIRGSNRISNGGGQDGRHEQIVNAGVEDGIRETGGFSQSATVW